MIFFTFYPQFKYFHYVTNYTQVIYFKPPVCEAQIYTGYIFSCTRIGIVGQHLASEYQNMLCK